MHSNTFTFENWEKTNRLTKHAKSACHQQAMMKWIDYRAKAKHKTLVLGQLNTVHKQQVAQNREYLNIIIETLLFTAQQNIAQRGHEGDRSNLGEVSDINRGNFWVLLHLRSKNIPWLGEKLKSHLDAHMQWTSPIVQNEILDIMAEVVLGSIANDVKKCSGKCPLSLMKRQTSAGLSKSQYASDLSLKEKPGSLSSDFMQRLLLKEVFSVS